MKKALLALGLIAALTGCENLNGTTTAAQALSVVTAATNVKYYYENGEAVNFIDNAELTDLETTQVLEALDQVERSKARLKSYKDNPEKLIVDLPNIAFEYAKLKAAYLSVRAVVVENRSEYTDREWDTFVRFDVSAQVLDEQFSALLDMAEANAALMTALRLADTALKASSMI